MKKVVLLIVISLLSISSFSEEFERLNINQLIEKMEHSYLDLQITVKCDNGNSLQENLEVMMLYNDRLDTSAISFLMFKNRRLLNTTSAYSTISVIKKNAAEINILENHEILINIYQSHGSEGIRIDHKLLGHFTNCLVKK